MVQPITYILVLVVVVVVGNMSHVVPRGVSGNAQNNGTDLANLDDRSNVLALGANANDNANDNNLPLTREEKWDIVKRAAITNNLGKVNGKNEKLVDVYHKPVGRSGTGRTATAIWNHFDRQIYKYEQLDSIAEEPEYRYVARGYCKHCEFNAGSDSARLTHIKQCSAVTQEIRAKFIAIGTSKKAKKKRKSNNLALTTTAALTTTSQTSSQHYPYPQPPSPKRRRTGLFGNADLISYSPSLYSGSAYGGPRAGSMWNYGIGGLGFNAAHFET